MEYITDEYYLHAQRSCKNFEIKHLGEYHDLYPNHDALLLADVFENFRNICFKNYQLDPAKNLPAPVLPWKAALKTNQEN